MNEIMQKFYKTALYLAIENDDIEIVKLLLNNDKTDVNLQHIFFINWFIKFQIKFFDSIRNRFCQYNSELFFKYNSKLKY